MRLQLVIQRHSLPPVQLLWTVGHLHTSFAAAGASFTVCQLLEQINEIVPLEAEDWGLEDYAVEVGGFECLHFSEISHVLREDDVVCVRPLQTSDLRFRKISGRHQISADGKHLIDGVAFGRPFLRQVNRPPIIIPPRKRRRITYEEGDDSVLNADNRQVAVRVKPRNGDSTLAENDSDDDGELSPDEDGARPLSTELEDIYNDNDAEDTCTDRATNLNVMTELPGRLTRSKTKRGLGIQAATGLKLVDENGIPYSESYRDALLDLFANDPLHAPKQISKERGEGNQKLTDRAHEQTALRVYRGQPERSIIKRRTENVDSTTPVTIRDIQDSDRSSDEDFEPTEDIMEDPDESDKENSQPNFVTHEPRVSLSSRTSSSSSTSSELRQDDTTSSSESSSEDNSSDSEPEQFPTTSGAQSLSPETSSLSRSSNGGSDTNAERAAGKVNETVAAVSSTFPFHANCNSQGSETKIKAGTQFTQHSALPYQGKKGTQLRNQRRRTKKKLERERNRALLPSDAADGRQKLNGAQNNTKVEKSTEGSQPELVGLRTHSQPSRIASPREPKSPDSFRQNPSVPTIEGSTGNIDEATSEGVEIKFVHDQARETQNVEHSTNREPMSRVEVTEVALNNEIIPKARSKLDLASSRRMLFRSLGLRTPKSGQGKSETRERLTKSFPPVKESQPQCVTEASRSLPTGELEEDGIWTQKVVLRAVECCYEGIELSTPPFPFVQRWDPQQQGGNRGFVGGKSRKSKKRKRNDSQLHPRIFERKSETFAHTLPSVSVEDLHEKNTNPSTDIHQPAVRHEANGENEAAVNPQSMREIRASTNASADYGNTHNLPVLPQDMSTCISLTREKSTPGAIVAFKQLDMSQETNWQPRVSEYRTATVDRLMENGMLRMILAQRDRPQNQKSYDEQTGERIYSKFEMPGLDDEESLEDGAIELSFAELIDPKMIRPASDEEIPAADQVNDQQCFLRGGRPTVEADVFISEAMDLLPNNTNIINTKFPNGSLDAHETDEEREGVRKEIFELIKDSGWRSSIGLNIVDGKVFNEHFSLTDQINEKEKESILPGSPNFPVFCSSPPTGVRNETRLGERNSLVDETTEKEESALPISPNFPGFSSSPPIAEEIESKLRKQDPLPDQTSYHEEESAFPGFGSSPPTTARAKANSGKQRTEGLTSDLRSSPESTKEFGVANILPLQRTTESKSPSGRFSHFGDENLGQKMDDDDEDLAWNEPPLTSDVVEADHQVASQELNTPSSPYGSPLHPVQSDTQDSQYGSPRKAPLSSDSDNEFPKLEDVFSQIKSSYEPCSFGTEDSKHVRTSSFETVIPREEPVSSLPAWRPDGKEKVPQKQTLFAWPQSNDEDRIVHGTQAPMQSQIVDLTLSSDPIPDDNYVDYGTQLPTGPGWVQKTRASVGRAETVKRERERTRRTRST